MTAPLPKNGSGVALIGNSALSLINFRGPLIRLLVAKGMHVDALAPDFDEASRAAIRALGARPIHYSLDRTGLRLRRDGADLLGLWRVLRRLRPAHVLTFMAKPNIYGTLAAMAASVPNRIAMIEGLGFVFTDDGGVDGKRRALQIVTKVLYGFALLFARRAIFLNRDDVAFFTRNRMVARNKVLMLGGIGVPLDQFDAVPPSEGSRPTFIMVARLLREKGVAEYLAAAAEVKRRHPDARFLLLGGHDPNPGSFPADEVRRYVANGVVEWPGAVDDVRPWIAESSVFVLPSYREGVPRSTQEAMAMARPVITTDAPGCRETVEPGVNGLMVPVRSAEALAAAMLWFFDNLGSIRAMGSASRRLAEERFDAAAKNETIYRLLADFTPP